MGQTGCCRGGARGGGGLLQGLPTRGNGLCVPWTCPDTPRHCHVERGGGGLCLTPTPKKKQQPSVTLQPHPTPTAAPTVSNRCLRPPAKPGLQAVAVGPRPSTLGAEA